MALGGLEELEALGGASITGRTSSSRGTRRASGVRRLVGREGLVGLEGLGEGLEEEKWWRKVIFLRKCLEIWKKCCNFAGGNVCASGNEMHGSR